MKFSKTSLMILGTGILVIILVSLYFNYTQKVSQRDVLFNSINIAQQALSKLSAERSALDPQLAQLEEKLSQTSATLTRAKQGYPASIEAIEYGTELVQLADDASLTITSLNNVAATSKDEGNITYNVTTFSLVVKGKVSDLLDFIHTIAQSRDFGSALIENIEMSDMNGEEPSLSFTIIIYSYQGD
jgi:hypothetical protein